MKKFLAAAGLAAMVLAVGAPAKANTITDSSSAVFNMFRTITLAFTNSNGLSLSGSNAASANTGANAINGGDDASNVSIVTQAANSGAQTTENGNASGISGSVVTNAAVPTGTDVTDDSSLTVNNTDSLVDVVTQANGATSSSSTASASNSGGSSINVADGITGASINAGQSVAANLLSKVFNSAAFNFSVTRN